MLHFGQNYKKAHDASKSPHDATKKILFIFIGIMCTFSQGGSESPKFIHHSASCHQKLPKIRPFILANHYNSRRNHYKLSRNHYKLLLESPAPPGAFASQLKIAAIVG